MRYDDTYKFKRYYDANEETRWADEEEIMNSSKQIRISTGHFDGGGIPMISNGEEVWVDDLDTHSLIFGSTGSKKSRLYCMPMVNILAGAGESMIITDPKGELYDKTSGYVASHGYKIVVMNFRDMTKGDTWNPLELPYTLYHQGRKDDAYARISDFVDSISQKMENNSRDIFWSVAAGAVANSILQLMMEICSKEECNLKTFTRFCIEFAKEPTDAYMKQYVAEDEIKLNYLNQLMDLLDPSIGCSINYKSMAGSSERARGDIQGTLFAIVSPFVNQERLVSNMSRSNFDIESIGKEKTAVYIIVPDEKSTYHFVASTFVKQCYEVLIESAQKSGKKLKKRVNFILDEFANIPSIPDMPSMITAARSRNMRFFLVIQSLHQLINNYGEQADTIKGNCDNWIFLSSKELRLLEEISELCGSLRRGDDQSSRVPLISPSQLQRLRKEKGEALIFHSRNYPFITEMADIDQYAFEKLKPIPMNIIDKYDPISFGPEEYYQMVVNREKNIPFTNKKCKTTLTRSCFK